MTRHDPADLITWGEPCACPTEDDDHRLSVGDEVMFCGARETDGPCRMWWPCPMHGGAAA